MLRPRRTRFVRSAVALTACLLLARLFPAPPLIDAVTGEPPPGLHLEVPPIYLIFAPLFTLWDGVSMLPLRRLLWFAGVATAGFAVLRLAGLVWRRHAWDARRSSTPDWLRELRAVTAFIAGFGLFVGLGALWHRPMLALAGTEADDVVVDYHSHTNASHDVDGTWMARFDAEANRRWHARAGFDVAFVTDHNTATPVTLGSAGVRTQLCPGTEVSAWRSHIVLPGTRVPVERRRFNSSGDSLWTLLQVSDSAYGAPSIASLPEYTRHWDLLGEFVTAGLDGFEIVNASPKASGLTRAEQARVIALARERNRFVVGASDSHGWGATSMVWNLVRAPGWRASSVAVCATLEARLRTGFEANRVIDRHRLRDDSRWPLLFTPLGVVWETWRGMGWALTASWLVWIWVLAVRGRRV